MPYSKQVEVLLKQKEINVGDRIEIIRNGKTFQGILMPRIESGDTSKLIIKLDSGYNIGIGLDHVKVNKVKSSEETEMGKTKKSLLSLSFDTQKPPVSLIATGGTIASRVDYRTGGVYMQMDPKEFLYNVPELADIANLKILSPFKKASEDMDSADWIEIAKVVAKELNSGASGVIVTHGTDTLHYTAAALSFFLKNLSKPVVLTGAQKSSDRGSSDSFLNLIASARIAVSDMAEVGICMHGSPSDDYCLFIRGTKARKMDAVRRDSFRPINDLPLAKIFADGKIEKLNPACKKNGKGTVEVDAKFEPKVAMLKAYPGSDPSIIEYYMGKGYKGFVVEGTGLGHVPTFAKNPWISLIKKYSKDVPFVVTSQAMYGRVNTDVYTNLRILFHDSGAISGQDMTTESAYVKLGWVLGHTKDLEETKKLILTNIAGEITGRTLPETFLY